MIKESHEKFLSNFLNTGNSNLLHQMSNLFVMNKAGYC